MSRRLRLVAAGVGEHDCCRPKVCDGVLSRLAVRAVLLHVAALMEASRLQACALNAKRYAEMLHS
jgi:hypothetical protein